MEQLFASNYRISLCSFEGNGERPPVLFLLNDGELLSEIWEGVERSLAPLARKGTLRPLILAGIYPSDREREYSPWPMKPVFKKSPSFTGGAKEYLENLEKQILPVLCGALRFTLQPENTGVIGYSLGGLAALFALYQSGVFGLIGSLSSSLWFEGWEAYVDTHAPLNPACHVFLSLGDREPVSRNPVLATVGKATEHTASRLAKTLASPENVSFIWEQGGHFGDPTERFVHAFAWLLQ